MVSRVFQGRRGRDPRLPPGQYDVGSSFPVLTAEATPDVRTQTWSFRVDGSVRAPRSWTWDELRALPEETWQGDIHCVTTWSKLGTSFTGVSLDVLLDAVDVAPSAAHALAWSVSGYTTNLPLEDVTGGRAWLVWAHEGEPLSADHGGPVRLLVPHLYFWKSAKWVGGLRVLDADSPGFWETRGYHHRGDPWREQRYDGD
ncbi:sulfite oxidase-like oxidoreductase [Quadrisphaera sp. DSM 44207]|uniref:sulfite oxidase-like oxidoreductase n=1 Tax=Quadrisphaera sp. DSM 44207 TaxID=1881057 RepID=UPI000882B1AA|nr:sulfite oxidase-like oxidoreductase [Quadrisphaera sp. DSM 44207]SDQ49080.1 DMSO/TMAO reductase YedYZ, molybdopterin-dependent catalytic subunit [Quadrisphaera sp. DSM 44207]